jgi:hypothetical protein
MIDKEQLKAKMDAPKIRQLQGISSPQYPSNLQMAKNLGNSVVRNIRSVASGNNLRLSDEEANKRFEICNNCEFFNKLDNRCLKCGCYMAIKTYLKAERCPIGKW